MDRGTRVALGAMALAVFVIANDFTSLGVALPKVERGLDVGVDSAQWVMNAYTLVFGVLIVTGGHLGDLYGRRRMFFLGISIFAFFSALAGLAPDAQTLIAARAAMGIGAALVWPAVIGLTFSLVPEDRAGIAGGLILGVSGLGNALGPMIGGVLSDELSWRWILFLNVPIAAVALVVVARHVAGERVAGGPARIDYAGVATLSLGLVALLVALDQSPDWGWGDPRVIALLAFSVVSLAAMVAIQRRGGHEALVPRDVIGNRAFGAACLATVLASGMWFTVLLYAPQYLEKILDFSALRSGVALLPLMLVFSVTSFAAGPLYNKVGPRLPLLLGTVGIALGGLLFSLVGAASSYPAVLPGLVVMGVGVGLFYSTLTTAALGALDPARASVGSGLTFMFQLVGGAIGVGIMTTVFSGAANGKVAQSSLASHLGRGEEHAVGQVLSGTTGGHALLAQFPAAAVELRDLAREAFVTGLHAGLRVDAAIALLALAGTAILIRAVNAGVQPSGSSQPEAGTRSA